MRWRTTVAVLGLLALVVQAGCRDDGGPTVEGADAGERDEAADDTTTPTEPPRPAGPSAELTGPLTDGRGIDLASPRPVDLAAAGWVEEEYAAAGVATSYRAVGDLPFDGTFELEADATAEYRTRIVVRRPADADDFNGTVVVEWLNVSGGLDAAPDFAYLGDELLRGGYAWVGVSAQRIGIEGGQAAVGVPGADTGGGIKAGDPERYGDLRHPGDAYAYDLFTQVARALREPGPVDALGGLAPQQILAVGESQSGFALTTYVNGVQPLTGAFDGFLVHSRGAAAAPLGEPGAGFDIASTIGLPPAQIRTDGDAPVLVLETETDVLGFLGYHAARQPDGDRFRLWEVAGTAHADRYLLGPLADLLDCGAPINAGPHHFVAKAALRQLDRWVRTGGAPPEAPRLEVDDAGSTPVFVRDEDGIARGGIRTPHVDVPVATLSGEPGPGGSVVCALLGTTVPLPPERLAARYPDRDAYLSAWEAAADAVVDAGFVLPEDRAELLADAQPDVLGG